jgi:hypothetical protein
MIGDTPWYVPNTVILRDLQTPKQLKKKSAATAPRLSAHPNGLTVNLMEPPDNRRLRRHLPNYLPAEILSVIVVFVILVFKVTGLV